MFNEYYYELTYLKEIDIIFWNVFSFWRENHINNFDRIKLIFFGYKVYVI